MAFTKAQSWLLNHLSPWGNGCRHAPLAMIQKGARRTARDQSRQQSTDHQPETRQRLTLKESHNGHRRTHPLSHPVCREHQLSHPVPHHHHRAVLVLAVLPFALCPQPGCGLGRGLLFLDQGVCAHLCVGRGFGHCDEFPVRHQLAGFHGAHGQYFRAAAGL